MCADVVVTATGGAAEVRNCATSEGDPPNLPPTTRISPATKIKTLIRHLYVGTCVHNGQINLRRRATRAAHRG